LAAALADSYTATVKDVFIDDWYLPSLDELNQMCKWQRGRPWVSDATICAGGTLNSGPGAAGFTTDNFPYYFSSSEKTSSIAWIQIFSSSGSQGDGSKNATVVYVRPVRAF
jgi:type II secretory pathway pseudopilin PulG